MRPISSQGDCTVQSGGFKKPRSVAKNAHNQAAQAQFDALADALFERFARHRHDFERKAQLFGFV